MLDIAAHQSAVFSAPLTVPYAKQELANVGFSAPVLFPGVTIPVSAIAPGGAPKPVDKFRAPEPIKQPYLPRFAMEPGDNEMTYLKSRVERLEIMINGATLGVSAVCNMDGSITVTAGITWGS